jgi:hypothetical protein
MADFSFLADTSPEASSPSTYDQSRMRSASDRMTKSYSSVCAGKQRRPKLKNLKHDGRPGPSEISKRAHASSRSSNQEACSYSGATTPHKLGVPDSPDRGFIPTVDDFLADEFSCRASICHYLSEGETGFFEVDDFVSENCIVSRNSDEEQSPDSAQTFHAATEQEAGDRIAGKRDRPVQPIEKWSSFMISIILAGWSISDVSYGCVAPHSQ